MITCHDSAIDEPMAGSAGQDRFAAAIDDVALLPVDNPYLLAVGVMLASLLQILDSTIANVAIPHMQATLGATPDEISWVLTSYIVAVAVAMPITGWLADRFGSRRLFILSVAGFVLSSMLCGMAQNITEMVIFRALQGATGAFISPLSQAAMIDTNKPSRQAQMMAVWGMGIMIGPIMGPILGGWLTENWNWRSVFYVNVPLGIMSLAILTTQLPSRQIMKRRFDLTGFALLAVTLTSSRFVVMVVTLFSQLDDRDHKPRLYAAVHLVAMTAWALSMRDFHAMPRERRAPFFLGLALVCGLVTLPGTLIGFWLAGSVHPAVTLAMVLINAYA